MAFISLYPELATPARGTATADRYLLSHRFTAVGQVRTAVACGICRTSLRIRPSTSVTVRSAWRGDPGSCVTMTIVRFSRRFNSTSVCMISSPVARSRLPVGSSASSTLGRDNSARAIAARCISPPDSSRGLCFADAPGPTSSSSSYAPAAMLPAAQPVAEHALGDHRRRQDVFQRRELRQQVIELKDHAEVALRSRSRAGGGQVVDAMALEVDFAGVGLIERAEQVQQRALAAAAGADDRHELALADLEVDALQHGDLERRLAVALEQAAAGQVHRASGASDASPAPSRRGSRRVARCSKSASVRDRGAGRRGAAADAA